MTLSEFEELTLSRTLLEELAAEVGKQEGQLSGGTRVPLTLIHQKGMARDGQNPVRLTGYGGYGVNLTPGFDPSLLTWLEQGGDGSMAAEGRKLFLKLQCVTCHSAEAKVRAPVLEGLHAHEPAKPED